MNRLLLAILVLLPSLVHATGLATDQITMKPQASPTCTSGRACLYGKSGTSRVYITDSAGLELQTNAARMFRSSADCSALSSPANGDVCYDTALPAFRYYSSGWTSQVTQAYVNAAAPEIFFTRTCTLTSAAAATPVTCLADADVPAGKAVHLMGWHAKVNGATAWATVATCTVNDTGGGATLFFTMAVAALIGNAFVGDWSSNITQAAAYSLNSGGVNAKGLKLLCDTNGTGSDLVMTIFGTIK